MDGWMNEMVAKGMGLSTMGSRGKRGGRKEWGLGDVVDIAPVNMQEKVARRKSTRRWRKK